MFEHLLLLAVIVAGMTFVRLLRRSEAHQRGYTLLVGGLLAMGLWGLSAGDRFLTVVVVSLVVLAVIVPWALELMARRAFAVGRLGIAVRLAGLRAIMMPGGGLGRQQDILKGLAVLERDGVDAAISHFRGLAGDTDDGGELAVIHEQIVSMLFYGQRWSEGIAHYEGQFHPGYAALRPALALGLMRAYGESDRLGNAAGLLRALEEGPLGNDPRAYELISQARLTFLAYAGQAGAVTSALAGNQHRVLGLSPASGALYRGIALARAGQRDRAHAELSRVESLAGPKDDRVVEASRSTLARLDELDRLDASMPDLRPELAPDLLDYAGSVAERLQNFLRVAPGLRRRAAPLVATGTLCGILFAFYLALETLGRGGMGLLTLGAATLELWAAGSWARMFTAPFVHADVISLLVDLYAVGLAGSMLERIHGRARVVVVAVVPAVVGMFVALSVPIDPAMIPAGGALIGFSLTTAGLIAVRRPAVELSPRLRRSMTLTLLLVMAAEGLTAIPGVGALDVSLPGIGASVLLSAVLSFALPVTLPRLVQRVESVAALGLLALVAGAAFKVSTEDVEGFQIANRVEQEVPPGTAVASVPPAFIPLEERVARPDLPIPLEVGLVDSLQLRTGNVLSLSVAEPPPQAQPDGEPTPAVGGDTRNPVLFRIDPELERRFTAGGAPQLPDPFLEALGQAEIRAFTVRRNGEPVARVVERGVEGGRTLVLVAAPPATLEHAPALYGAVMADFRPVEPEAPSP